MDKVVSNEKSMRPVLIAAGGTGGHVFPALAIAQGLRELNRDVIWLGTRTGIESRVVPENKFVIHYVDVVGVRGKSIVYWLKAPFLMLVAVVQVVQLLIQLKPICVLGMGGFASAAAGVAAFLTRTPLILQEQNAVAGTTNKLLAPIAKKIFTGFPAVLGGNRKVCYSGNPLRDSFYHIVEPEVRLQHLSLKSSDADLPLSSGKIRLLVLGGSLGAQIINEVLPVALGSFSFDVVHQTGSRDFEAVVEAYGKAGIQAKVTPFIDDMTDAYVSADLVIARAGALTISELAAVGVASILVPYPHATDNHQCANADWLVEVNAAIKIEQTEFSVDKLKKILAGLLENRATLLTKAINARCRAKPRATNDIVAACQEYAYV